MKFTVNIPVTRKRTKHGYYLILPDRARLFFLHRNEVIKGLKNFIHFRTDGLRIMTARDYAKKRK